MGWESGWVGRASEGVAMLCLPVLFLVFLDVRREVQAFSQLQERRRRPGGDQEEEEEEEKVEAVWLRNRFFLPSTLCTLNTTGTDENCRTVPVPSIIT
jgi:hypothetical protein